MSHFGSSFFSQCIAMLAVWFSEKSIFCIYHTILGIYYRAHPLWIKLDQIHFTHIIQPFITRHTASLIFMHYSCIAWSKIKSCISNDLEMIMWGLVVWCNVWCIRRLPKTLTLTHLTPIFMPAYDFERPQNPPQAHIGAWPLHTCCPHTVDGRQTGATNLITLTCTSGGFPLKYRLFHCRVYTQRYLGPPYPT